MNKRKRYGIEFNENNSRDRACLNILNSLPDFERKATFIKKAIIYYGKAVMKDGVYDEMFDILPENRPEAFIKDRKVGGQKTEEKAERKKTDRKSAGSTSESVSRRGDEKPVAKLKEQSVSKPKEVSVQESETAEKNPGDEANPVVLKSERQPAKQETASSEKPEQSGNEDLISVNPDDDVSATSVEDFMNSFGGFFGRQA